MPIVFGAKRRAEAERDLVRALTSAQLRVGRVTEQIESAVIGLQEAIVERRSDLLGEVECETRTGLPGEQGLEPVVHLIAVVACAVESDARRTGATADVRSERDRKNTRLNSSH